MNADNYTNKDSAEKKSSVKTLVTRAKRAVNALGYKKAVVR